jgi:hypothetical protein
MNALELANNLDKYYTFKKQFPQTAEDVITLLRQQQAEIDALKLQLSTTLTNRELRTYDGKVK